MFVHVIIAYFLVFWWPEERPLAPILTSAWATCLFVFGKLIAFWLIARRVSSIGRRSAADPSGTPSRAQHVYHQAIFALGVITVVGPAADMALTVWPEYVRGSAVLSAVPGLADLVLLVPFFASLVLLWTATYPVDRIVRESVARARQIETPGAPSQPIWALGQYLIFHVRHQLLIAAVPMTLILCVLRVGETHRVALIRWFGVPWANEAMIGAAAALIFVFAPVMLRFIWSTSPLPAGPLRQRLDALCRRVGLRYRNILVWHSHHMMVNAAVMGIFPRVRYVLLSDALLESMDHDRIEAVFGHEAGHVKHHHIQYFLLFTASGLLLVMGIMEVLIRVSTSADPLFVVGDTTIEALGFVGVAVVWGLGFGWVSRCFERQADLYGARCVTPPQAGCAQPCAAHPGDGAAANSRALCATAAAVFVSALERVAVLNGIPRDERNWRHSSIAARVRFLTSLVGDSLRLRRYDRLIRRIKTALWTTSVTGAVIAGWYVWERPGYRRVFEYNFVRPFTSGRTAGPSTPYVDKPDERIGVRRQRTGLRDPGRDRSPGPRARGTGNQRPSRRDHGGRAAGGEDLHPVAGEPVP